MFDFAMRVCYNIVLIPLKGRYAPLRNFRQYASGFFLALLLFLGAFPFCAVAGDGYADLRMVRTLRQEKQEHDNTRWIEVPGRGEMLFYAQNNPFWDKMRYEATGSPTYRNFGDGGCCPTSTAIAIANLLPVTELGKIRVYASRRANGYGISVASMNPLNSPRRNGTLWLDQAEDYQRYLPLVFGQYAAGNNAKGSIWRVADWSISGRNGGTGAGFVPGLCEIYGLTYLKVAGKANMDWIAPIKQGALAVALANSRWHPFATGNGHYVTIVGCDDVYVYIMDPQNKTEYSNSDRKNVLEVLEPGLVRVKLSNFNDLMISMVHVIAN